LTYDQLEPWYGEAEMEIGVSGDHDEWQNYLGAYRSRPYPMSRIWPSYADTVVKRVVEGVELEGVSIRVMSTPQARNSQPFDGRPPCAGNSTCDPICPIQAKYDATTHIEKAELRTGRGTARSTSCRAGWWWLLPTQWRRRNCC
jgi:choline dehydrogenase-like flavoprotein